MSLSEEMAELLAALRDGGTLDSQGEFTLDFAKAVSKLREYQLARPEEYVAKWVQAAVAAGATEIRFKISGDVLSFGCDRLCLEREELEGMARFLVRPAGRPERVHLATGVNSALATEPVSMVLESHTGEATHTLAIAGENQQSASRPGRGEPGMRILLRRGAFAPELAALQRRALYCPVPIRVNGRPLPEGLFGSPALPPLLRPFQPVLKAFNRFNSLLMNPVLGAHKSSVNVAAGDDPVMPWWVLIWNVEDYVFGQCHRHHHLIERRCPGPALRLAPSSASVVSAAREGDPEGALALEMDLRPEATLRFVHHGVVVDEKSPVLGFSGAVATLPAAGLQTDLSQFRLVEDDAYRAVLERLKAEFAELTAELRARLEQDTSSVPLGRHVLGRLRRG